MKGVLLMSFVIIMQKSNLYDSQLLEETLTFHVIIHIKSFFNKDKYNYYYNIFLEKGLYELPENSNNK